MTRPRRYLYGILAYAFMSIIIIDNRSATSSISEGIALCMQTVIPSLFPFLILSKIINNCFIGESIFIMKPICRICKIPTGTESILLIGLMSGYPVGAKLVAQAYAAGNITKTDAMRLLGFCSNAGPAFFFGLLSKIGRASCRERV